jgi:hypothetical protein
VGSERDSDKGSRGMELQASRKGKIMGGLLRRGWSLMTLCLWQYSLHFVSHIRSIEVSYAGSA